MQQSLIHRLRTNGILKDALWLVALLVAVWAVLGAPSLGRMLHVGRTGFVATSKPDLLMQIAEPGAVVALADMPFVASRFTKRGKFQQYKGMFHAGQHLCASLVTWGDGATLDVHFPDDYLAEASNAPGNFRPDSSANGCARIPAVHTMPDPNSASIAARANIGDYGITHTARLMAAIYAAVFLVGLWFRERLYRPRQPMTLESLKQYFVGFAVEKSDFEASGKTLYRVNSDGQRINLDRWPYKWHFDKDSGEFLRIKRRVGERVIVDTTPYGQRFVKDARTVLQKLGKGLLGTALTLVSLFFAAMAAECVPEKQGVALIIACVVAAFVVGFFALKKFLPVITNWQLVKIGPQPLRHAIPEFGAQQPHGTSADEGMI